MAIAPIDLPLSEAALQPPAVSAPPESSRTRDLPFGRLTASPYPGVIGLLQRATPDEWVPEGGGRATPFIEEPLEAWHELVLEDATEQVHLRLWIEDLLRGLAPRERDIVVLRHLHDLTEAETAARLGISIGHVKATTSRALGRLRRELVVSVHAVPQL